jgi:large subunit ribosomal protein L13e
LAINVERLKDYQKRLIIFPRRSGKFKKGDASKEDVESAKKGDNVLSSLMDGLPFEPLAPGIREVKVSEMGKGDQDVYRRLRTARSDARLVGVREKRAKAKADEAAAKK